jgi:hypothetical protein
MSDIDNWITRRSKLMTLSLCIAVQVAACAPRYNIRDVKAVEYALSAEDLLDYARQATRRFYQVEVWRPDGQLLFLTSRHGGVRIVYRLIVRSMPSPNGSVFIVEALAWQIRWHILAPLDPRLIDWPKSLNEKADNLTIEIYKSLRHHAVPKLTL